MSSDTDSEVVNLTKPPMLNRSDIDSYDEWSAAMQAYLRIQGVWRIVSGITKRPDSARSTMMPKTETETQTKTETTTAATDELRREIKEWDLADEKAHGIICSALPTHIQLEVIWLGSSNAVWECLRKKFDFSDTLSLDGLRTVTGLTYDGCNSLVGYIDDMAAALNRLERSLGPGEKLNEGIKVQFLLLNLGHRWEGFLSSYLHSRYNKRALTFDRMSQVLIQEMEWQMR